MDPDSCITIFGNAPWTLKTTPNVVTNSEQHPKLTNEIANDIAQVTNENRNDVAQVANEISNDIAQVTNENHNDVTQVANEISNDIAQCCPPVPNKKEGKQGKVQELEDWDAPDPRIESDLSGSDYEEGTCKKEKTRDWRKSRGQSVTDTKEDDTKIDKEDAEEDPDLECEEEEACEGEERRSKGKKPLVTDTEEEEERDWERDEQVEAQSKAACLLLSTMKTEGKVQRSSTHWKDLTASYTPSQLDAASVLSSYGLTLMPDALLPDLEEVSSTKPSLLEMALYLMFGQILWQVAHRLGHLYGRSSEFAMEKAGLWCKEKRAPNQYNMFKTYASRTKPEEGDHKGLQLWNKATNEEYKKLMEGATTKEEKDERIQDAVSFIKNQVHKEGTNVRDMNLHFASHMKEICDLVHRFVYSGKSATARKKSGFFMSSEDLQALCDREKWAMGTLTDIFVSKVHAMHADHQIKQSMEELNVAPSTTASSSTACAPTRLASALKEEASSDKDVLPYTKEYACLAEKDQCKSAPWTMWPNLAYQFKLVITGWDSAMVDIAFCPEFAPTKITSSQWKHLSTLIVKNLLEVKPWSDEQRLIPESEACFGEIPVIINSDGLPMVFVKDSTKCVRSNCSISGLTKKRDRKGDTSSPVNSFSLSPALSTKKRSHDTAMASPEEELKHKSTREYRPLPKQPEVEPPAKRQRHVSFTSLPDNISSAHVASSSRSVSQPFASTSGHAHVSGKRAGPGKNSQGCVPSFCLCPPTHLAPPFLLHPFPIVLYFEDIS
ncbi:uncharacterized protein LACBIDRAFT_332752 [Laccaria bicolor S238N-H82]|uniref:Predicted protein n=1 Tax=Laccaria bicolor (strain S238N-H82 / ATCC MYA-4686) TaxID=486041 RepID=B0DTZ2_LACBS|nr:uncharacterized protein LACBIDRAFT_332752 [Laccaria bicolor S238N-H82]EDR01996.1 predicted protein [Laccaria bicolor S238N-H82]|eukprot:XP_001887387.1 predicted protein [Laccaria bicolor S238N-H82]